MVAIPNIDPRRLRSYVFRLPLCTRLLLLAIVLFWIAGTVLPWVRPWAALTPNEVGLQTMYRLNTYPLSHLGFFHFLLNILALAPLLERFEAENGTLVTAVLFTGPFATLPGALYILLERFLFRANTSASGSSIWIFLLLASEAIRTWRANPFFSLPNNIRIPTWTSPLFLILVIHFLVPQTSLIGHLCGAAVGYLWGLGYIKFLVPPEKILRWIEGKLNLLGRLPHYVSVDQKTYGRFGVLPTNGGVPLRDLGGNVHGLDSAV